MALSNLSGWNDMADVWVCQMEKYRGYDKFKKCSKCELTALCRGCPAERRRYEGSRS